MSRLRGSEHVQFSVSSEEVLEHSSTQKIFDEVAVVLDFLLRITGEVSFDLKSWDPGALRNIFVKEMFPSTE